jgi:hypothetical protein
MLFAVVTLGLAMETSGLAPKMNHTFKKYPPSPDVVANPDLDAPLRRYNL